VLVASFSAKASFPPDPGWSGVHPTEPIPTGIANGRYGQLPSSEDGGGGEAGRILIST
jgi:hypothetical protein